MNLIHTELRRVERLAVADKLALSEDPRVFAVTGIEAETALVDSRRKVHLRSIDGAKRIMLVRAERELVRVVINE